MHNLLLIFLLGSLPLASFAYDKESTDQSSSYSANSADMALQIQKIDQEILILRAELAKTHEDSVQLRKNLQQLNPKTLAPELKQRFDALQDYLHQEINLPKTPPVDVHVPPTVIQSLNRSETNSATTFEVSPSNQRVIAILLPLSGHYEIVGSQLLAGIRQALKRQGMSGKLEIFDTAVYDTAHELWDVVKNYQPDLIFGPLEKDKAEAFQRLNTGVPTVYLNHVNRLYANEISLSPDREMGLNQVLKLLDNSEYQNILVLTDEGEASTKLQNAFHQAWSGGHQAEFYMHRQIEGTIGQTIETIANIKQSQAREQWLEKIVEQSLSVRPRARKDIEVVLSLVPQETAMQLSPFLSFYQLDSVIHVWYSSQSPDIDQFYRNLRSWRQTYAILPVYLSTESSLTDKTSKEETGLFYALGRVAVEIVNKLAFSDDSTTPLQIDHVFSNAAGHFYLLPAIYWVDRGVLKPVSEFSQAMQ